MYTVFSKNKTGKRVLHFVDDSCGDLLAKTLCGISMGVGSGLVRDGDYRNNTPCPTCTERTRDIGSDKHARLLAIDSISTCLSSILPLPVRILDNTTSGESWLIHLVMCSVQTWIWGQSVPFFRFARWIEIQAQIEDARARAIDPENPELCQLLYLQECRAGRHMHDIHEIEGLDYIDPASSLKRKTSREASRGAKPESRPRQPRQPRDTSAFD